VASYDNTRRYVTFPPREFRQTTPIGRGAVIDDVGVVMIVRASAASSERPLNGGRRAEIYGLAAGANRLIATNRSRT
jgi:hypothetical protein